MNSRKLAVTCLDHTPLHILRPYMASASSHCGLRIHDTAKPVTEWLSSSALLARLATMLGVLGCSSPNTFLLISITLHKQALPPPSVVLDSSTSTRDFLYFLACWLQLFRFHPLSLIRVRRCEIGDAGQRSRPDGSTGQPSRMGLLDMCRRSLRVLFRKKRWDSA